MPNVKSVELEAHSMKHIAELEVSVVTGVRKDGKPGNQASATKVRIRRDGTTHLSVDPFSYMANENGVVEYYDIDVELCAGEGGSVTHSISLKDAFYESWELKCGFDDDNPEYVCEEIVVRAGQTQYHTEGTAAGYAIAGFKSV